jgi:hypothetical protein
MCYTGGALETFSSKRVCSFPSLTTAVSNVVRLLPLVVVVLVCVVPVRAQQAIASVFEGGRPIFINDDDEEMKRAAGRGGAAAVRQLIVQRKQSMPGIERHIETVSRRHGVDPELVRAVIEVESGWNPRAVSRKGAMGLMQLMPDTGARYGVGDAFDPTANVSAGVRHLRWLLDRFDGDARLALAAYNAGETAVVTKGGVPPYRETRNYLDKLETLYGSLGPGRGPGNGRIFRTRDASGRMVYEND